MKITDDMLSAQAAEARELWLQACTPDALPEHRFSRKFRREMRRLVRAQKALCGVQPEPPSCAARPLFCCFPLRFRSAAR